MMQALLPVEGNGETGKVRELFEHWTQIATQLQTSLNKLNDLPIDVLPHYPIKGELLSGQVGPSCPSL
jgi:hypothetical protein